MSDFDSNQQKVYFTNDHVFQVISVRKRKVFVNVENTTAALTKMWEGNCIGHLLVSRVFPGEMEIPGEMDKRHGCKTRSSLFSLR